jgi:hypothetical protein
MATIATVKASEVAMTNPSSTKDEKQKQLKQDQKADEAQAKAENATSAREDDR